MVSQFRGGMKMTDVLEKVCYICGTAMPPGAHRRIGVCVNCIVGQKELEEVVRIPGPRYRGEVGDGDR